MDRQPLRFHIIYSLLVHFPAFFDGKAVFSFVFECLFASFISPVFSKVPVCVSGGYLLPLSVFRVLFLDCFSSVFFSMCLQCFGLIVVELVVGTYHALVISIRNLAVWIGFSVCACRFWDKPLGSLGQQLVAFEGSSIPSSIFFKLRS